MDPARVALGGMLLLAACNSDRVTPVPAPSAAASQHAAPASVIVKASDRGEVCTDLGSIRACWGGECGRAGCVGVRPLPEPAAISPLGWRCTGSGAERRCFERSSRAGAFECRENTCVQRHPRLPDDGEWLCADAAGAAVCAGGEPAAGVARARADAGWFVEREAACAPSLQTERAHSQAVPRRRPDLGCASTSTPIFPTAPRAAGVAVTPTNEACSASVSAPGLGP